VRKGSAGQCLKRCFRTLIVVVSAVLRPHDDAAAPAAAVHRRVTDPEVVLAGGAGWDAGLLGAGEHRGGPAVPHDPGGNTANGTQLQINNCSASPSQEFDLG
jgi:hypothetical protein